MNTDELTEIGNIVDLYPDRTLSVLWAVLPENVAVRPYEMKGRLDRTGSAKAARKKDKRLIELKRK